jgi:glyoxylase-like metal-dependent hydrolase (beta-lactamase superfamily II)
MITAIHLGLLVQLLAAGSQSDPDPYIRIDRLSPRVALAYWPGIDRRCNLTVIQSQKGLVIVDTEASPRVMAPIKRKIEQTFHRTDWAYVINTHAHDNHCSGNSLFKGATIIGHENLAADMQWLIDRQTNPDFRRREIDRYSTILRDLRTALPQYATNRTQARLIQSDIIFYDLFLRDLQEGYEVVKPSLTFSDDYKLDLGDLTLELIFFGKGHSASDILVYVPQERVLVTGAIAYQQYRIPEIGEETHLEDVRRFIAVLDRLLADDVQIDHVIPGHSVPLTRAVLPPIRDFYQRMLKEVRAARRQGLTLDQTTKLLTIRAKFPAFREPPAGTYGAGHQERNVKNLWRILDEEEQPSSKPEPAKP